MEYQMIYIFETVILNEVKNLMPICLQDFIDLDLNLTPPEVSLE